ncbi:MAG: hypothetical protein O3B09_00875 [Proteobacteria bacterium]|nr:hypothetical protein [Pseudomonadota bacterium]
MKATIFALSIICLTLVASCGKRGSLYIIDDNGKKITKEDVSDS